MLYAFLVHPRWPLTSFDNSGMYSGSEFVAPFGEADEKTMEMKESNDEDLYRVCGVGS